MSMLSSSSTRTPWPVRLNLTRFLDALGAQRVSALHFVKEAHPVPSAPVVQLCDMFGVALQVGAILSERLRAELRTTQLSQSLYSTYQSKKFSID